MPDFQRTSLQTFTRVAEILSTVNGKELYPNDMVKQTAIALHENWNRCTDAFPELYDTENGREDRIKMLMNILELLDFNDQFTPLILEHPEQDNEDFDELLSEILPRSKLSTNEGYLYRMVSLNAFHLGTSFAEMGNERIGFHMLLLAIAVHERIIRLTPRNTFDERITYSMYEKILRIGFQVKQYDAVSNYGMKLAHKLEIALTSAIENQAALMVNYDLAKVEFDFGNHFENLIILVCASKEVNQISTTTYAYEQAIELFSIEKRFESDGSILKFVEANPSFVFDLEKIPCSGEKEEVLLHLCLQLIEANESASGDAALSLKYARSALEHYSLSQAGPNNTLQESKLQFLCGRLIYKYILYLAGGVQHASSPPIAILPPSTNQPTIKSLLEESLDMLDEASKVAEIGKHDANCKEAVKIQMAFVAAELRMESHTKKILQDLNVDKSLLTEFDDSVKQHRQHRTHPYLAHVVYSPKVLKRVVLMMTEQPTVRKLTLSRKRTMNFDQPQKVLCSYCSMQCINTDLKCEYCAVGKVFVWYCTDECQSDHAQQHESQCLKNKTGNSLDFRSFLNVLTPT